MVHFPACSSVHLCIQCTVPAEAEGLPHSEIPGLKCACHYPRLIAAYHVLHRLSVPRHPSYALTNLTTKNLQQVTVSIRIFLTSFARLTCQCTKNGTAPLQRRPRNAPAFQKTLLCNCQRASALQKLNSVMHWQRPAGAGRLGLSNSAVAGRADTP